MSETYFSDGSGLISVSTADVRSIGYNLDIPEGSHGLPQIEVRELGGTSIPKTFFAFGLNHKTAPIEVRERFYIGESEVPALLQHLRPYLSECVVLSTCNRTEIYAVSNTRSIEPAFFHSLLGRFKDAEDVADSSHFFSHVSCAATHQLFSVAASVDSSVVGDSQILRQLRNAYSTATSHGCTGNVLNPLFQRAFKLGKQTYTSTSIHQGAISVSVAAVDFAIREYGSLRELTAIVIGAGQMARQTAEALLTRKIGRLIIANRTRANAEELLFGLRQYFTFDGKVIGLEELGNVLPKADIIISSTSSTEPILSASDFANQSRPTLAIDIAVPRDIDESVGTCENVILKDIDSLNDIVGGTRARRLRDLPKVDEMIRQEMVDFLTWYYTLPLLPEYEKTRIKPSRQQAAEVLRIKNFLNKNVSEIHNLYARVKGDFHQDLANHFELIERLRSMQQQTVAA